jgi:6-phosphogluconate dehydrogenase
MTTAMTSARPAQFAVLGLAVMGENLALNVEEHGFPIAIWDRTGDKVDRFIGAHGDGHHFVGAKTFEELIGSLERPRRLMMMIKAGSPVDEIIDKLKPFLQEGDILIDGGNSWFKDTQRREQAMRESRLSYVGMGVSGGEEGARHGPSLMPGGAREAYEHLRPIVEAISAKTDSGACVTYVGPDGAGHFVKMVHNGIEYGDMQLIAEAYDLLRNALGLSADELSGIFDQWNHGLLESFLIEITSKVLSVKDAETGKSLVDLILDKAGQKGTGKWTVQVALDLATPVPTIAAALDARLLSSMKAQRVAASKKIKGPRTKRHRGDKQGLISAVRDALYASKVCSYAQGMNLIRAGSDEYKWGISLREMARIWKGGCIIRASLLGDIMQAYDQQPDLPNLLLDGEFNRKVNEAQTGWRRALSIAQTVGVPVPAMSSALAYFDSYRNANLPQNLTQAQRDFFGAHTYERKDKPKLGFVHTDWSGKD